MGVPGVMGMIGGVRVLGDVGGFGGVGGIRPGKCGQKKSSWLFTDGYTESGAGMILRVRVRQGGPV